MNAPAHPRNLAGQCPTCHHYGDDCTGDRLEPTNRQLLFQPMKPLSPDDVDIPLNSVIRPSASRFPKQPK